jgi:DNA (cytosine-5)-methyltransferase 1
MKGAGFSPSHLIEKDPGACLTLRHNATTERPTLTAQVHEENVVGLDWRRFKGSVRLLFGGVPCQPFSLGGNHKADRDDRNHFPEMASAVEQLRPQAVLIENVQGLLRPAFRPYLEYVLRRLEIPSLKPKRNEDWRAHNARIRAHQCSVGYAPEYLVQFRLVNAADYGVPQHRTRVFVVATRYDLPNPVYRFPPTTHSKGTLLRIQDNGVYWEQHGIPRPERLPGRGKPPQEDDGLAPWVTVRTALRGLPAPSENGLESDNNHWTIPGARVYAKHSGGLLDWPSKTIKAGVHGVPGGENIVVEDGGEYRYYTLREAARIQTFPDEHIFQGTRTQITRQIGNAVPCRLAEEIARPLRALLSE